MAIALAVSGIAFAAFCVWLGVRIFNRRERWAKWTLVAVVGLPVLYALSFGPACWIVTGTGREQSDTFDRIFWPIGWFAENGPDFIQDVVEWYAMLASPRGSRLFLPSTSELDRGWGLGE